MSQRDWPIIWRNVAPAHLAADILSVASKRGQCVAYVHGDRAYITPEYIAEYGDDMALVASSRTSLREVIAKLIEAFDASKGDSP